MAFVEAGNHKLEYEWLGPEDRDRPVLVLLHQGLGSVAMWRDFPKRLSEASGLGALVYSRRGYGRSEPIADLSPDVDFMHTEARRDLPGVLAALDVSQPILVGQSDGASIALIYAGSGLRPEPLGVIAMAPHVFVEDETVTGAAKARVAYESGGLRDKLARYHDDPDSAFFRWNLNWLWPPIRNWNIETFVARASCPITVIQGEDDEYGTPRQLDSIARHTDGAADIVLLPGCGHSPQVDRPAETLHAMLRLIDRVTAGGAGVA